MSISQWVYLVDLTSESAEQLELILGSRGLTVMRYSSIEELLLDLDKSDASCIVTNLEIEQTVRCEIWRQLQMKPDGAAVIFITDSRNVSEAVHAMKEGAVEVIGEPFDADRVWDAIQAALRRNRQTRTRLCERAELQRRYDRLTKREREVLPLVLGGWLVKQCASALGIATITLQIHRTQIMRKMEAGSLADLVRMGIKLGIRHAKVLCSHTAAQTETVGGTLCE